MVINASAERYRDATFDTMFGLYIACKNAGVAQSTDVAKYFGGFQPEALAGQRIPLQVEPAEDGTYRIDMKQLSDAVQFIYIVVTP